MLHWSWNDYFGSCKVKCCNGKYRTFKIYYANCYFGTCIATWKEEDDAKGEFHYNPVFWFMDFKHAKRCINDGILDDCKDFVFYLDAKDNRTFDKETKEVIKLLVNHGIKVTLKKRVHKHELR